MRSYEVGNKRLEIIEESYEELANKYQLLKEALISTHETVAQFDERIQIISATELESARHHHLSI
jgi:hypothetical protein